MRRQFTDRARVCPECHVRFLIKPGGSREQRFCSRACAYAAVRGVRRRPLPERFWAKVRKTENCWLWTGALSHGCAEFYAGEKHSRRAARVSWELHRGAIPRGLHVLHRCDNPRCVRPDHLFLGTHLDNQRDKINKRRQARGDSHGHAKLTETKVREIRERYAAGGVRQKDLALVFRVPQSAISRIVHRKRWGHVS